MNILITNYHLYEFAGSELFTLNLAKELKKRGHNIFVFSPFVGKLAEKIRQNDIIVSDNIFDFANENIDIIHAQHNIPAIICRSVFPATPMIFMSHGILPDLEQPPSVELNISKFIAVSEEIKKHLMDKYSIENNKVEIIRNFVDTNRFKSTKAINKKPKKILVLSNHYVDEVKQIIEDACNELNIDVSHIGLPENPVDDVENYINEVDLVVTLGRGAIEAMSCGRNVIVYDMHGGDGFVDEKSFFEIRKNNFSGRRYSRKYSVEDFKKEILKYDVAEAKKLREIVLKENSEKVIVDKLESVYKDILKENRAIKSNFSGKELIREFQTVFNQVKDNMQLLDKNKRKLILLKNDIKRKNKKIKMLKQEVMQKNREINFMKTSKFWKLRNLYLRIKKNVKRFFDMLKTATIIIKRDGFVVFLKRLKISLRIILGNILSAVRLKDSCSKKTEVADVLVSVIIPIYDRVDELKDAIESILNQTFKNFELILVTDGSPQNTMKVVEKYAGNSRVRIFHYYDNTGNAVRGRNKGIKEARGKYIAFHDSDDIAEADRLEKSVKYIKKYNVDVVYGGWRVKTDGTRKINGLENGKEVFSPDCDLSLLKEVCVPCQSTVMVKRAALLDVGGLKNKMKYREDHELWLRLFYFGYKFKAIPCILTNLRIHKGNNELNFKKDDNKWKKIMLSEYKIKSKLPLKIAYIIPGTGISGGIAVILQHANRLLNRGYDVFLISQDLKEEINWFPHNKVPIISQETNKKYLFDNIDILIATGWSTASDLYKYSARRNIYFVQSDERRFFDDLKIKEKIHKTYKIQCEYMTEARWIQKWLKDEFGHDAHYVPNGLDEKIFFKEKPIKRESNKLRVLIEGPISIPFKGMKDAYNAIKDLDCEIWIISSSGTPKKNWRYDKFFESVPMNEMRKIYSSCDIFLKMSRIEGFFGPPMEAMACGCSVVVGKCTGYDEYIEHKKNALVVEMGDVDGAKRAVQRLIDDKKLRKDLIMAGYKTVQEWTWDRSITLLEKVVSCE